MKRDCAHGILATSFVVNYFATGVFHCVAGFFVYFVVMMENGFMPYTLFGIQTQWNDKSLADLQDSYGQEWVRLSLHIKSSKRSS